MGARIHQVRGLLIFQFGFFHLTFAALALFASVVGFSAMAQDQAGSVRKTDVNEDEDAPELTPLTEYMGRPVAQTMHYLGAEWLTRTEREREERCSLMVASLNVKKGATVCDMGCGNGFYTLRLCKLVGDKGHVYAVDIQPEMLAMLNTRAKKRKVKNFTPVLGALDDPRLPEGKIDMILLVDVYHEIGFPEQMLAAMRKSLAPDGTLVLVEFRAEDPEVPIKPEHKMTKAQIDKEMTANGFKLVKSFDKLPWQHMLWYGKDESFQVKTIDAEKKENP